MSRKNGASNGEGDHLVLGGDRAPNDAVAKEKWPTLVDVLWPRFKDGKLSRLAGRLGIKIIGGVYVLTVSAPHEQVQTTVYTSTLDGLLDVLEAHVRAPTTVWLPDFESQKKARQKALK